MVEHGLAIMRNQDTVVDSRAFQKFRIANAVQLSISGGREIDRGFEPPDGLDNRELEIIVRLEQNAQE
jgi:hypothetical protein